MKSSEKSTYQRDLNDRQGPGFQHKGLQIRKYMKGTRERRRGRRYHIPATCPSTYTAFVFAGSFAYAAAIFAFTYNKCKISRKNITYSFCNTCETLSVLFAMTVFTLHLLIINQLVIHMLVFFFLFSF